VAEEHDDVPARFVTEREEHGFDLGEVQRHILKLALRLIISKRANYARLDTHAPIRQSWPRAGALGFGPVLKREPGENPGLPRSGKRERRPRHALAARIGAGKRWAKESGESRSAREPEDLPTPDAGRNPAAVDLEPRGRRVGPSRRDVFRTCAVPVSPPLVRRFRARGGE
jgi:hypothetical protein